MIWVLSKHMYCSFNFLFCNSVWMWTCLDLWLRIKKINKIKKYDTLEPEQRKFFWRWRMELAKEKKKAPALQSCA